MKHIKVFLVVAAFCGTVGGLHAQVTVIDSGYCGAVGDGSNLTWVLTSDSVLTIYGNGDMAHYASPTVIPWYSYRSAIKTSVIGDSVTSIGNYAFSQCSSLNSVMIGNSVTSTGYWTFCLCKNLTSVTIGNSVTSIGNTSFADCISLTSINIPNSVTTIEYGAFGDCKSLTSITIPESVTTIGISAFDGCSNLQTVNYNAINCTIMWDPLDPFLGSVFGFGAGAFITLSIGYQVEAVPYGMFTNCSSITSITCYAITPPALDFRALYATSKTIPVYVPCCSISAYQDSAGWSDFSNFVPIAETIPTFSALSIAQLGNSFVLTWQGKAEYYELYRNSTLLDTIGSTTYTDTNLTDNVTYCYQIKAIDGDCESELSDTVCKMATITGICQWIMNNEQLIIISYEIYDMLGRNLTASLRGTQCRSNPEIIDCFANARNDVPELPSGIYIIKMQTNKGTITKKIVKY